MNGNQGLGANDNAMRAAMLSQQGLNQERQYVRGASSSTLIAELRERKTRLRSEITSKQKELAELEAAMPDIAESE